MPPAARRPGVDSVPPRHSTGAKHASPAAARAPATADRTPATAAGPGGARAWCLLPWSLGEGVTEILEVEAGAGTAAPMKMQNWAGRMPGPPPLPTAAALTPANWCLRQWTLGEGATEMQTMEAGAEAAAIMKMKARARRTRMEHQDSAPQSGLWSVLDFKLAQPPGLSAAWTRRCLSQHR